ncbi:MAG TPA: asparagine synthase (glutamine-hydrolyzing) [Nitrospira sp.]|nr:asparagine synthase (glutamine-hydrolyzing) [Nitrospira sp.]
MCGVAGIVSRHNGDLETLVSSMIAAIGYRGPDDSGIWSDHIVGVVLGHSRLSILDLSPEGHQPMVSVTGRYVLSYNGEIYNFRELRTELEQNGIKFRGHSDTEVMLAAFEAWGIEKAVQRFVGMFAFALWDRETHVLILGRDRLGIKPLYYGWAGGMFAFGSELKIFKQISGFDRSINRDSVMAFMRYAYIPEPWSIYQYIYKLPPGCLLSITPDQAHSRQGFSPHPDDTQARWRPLRYWSAKHIVEMGISDPFEGSDQDAIDRLDRLLRETIKLRMIADVPLGAFLSGGVDSSLVVALMQAQTGTPVKTFTIGFQEQDYNEAIHASAVAKHLGTQHTELYVTPAETMAVIPQLPQMYDEPFADSSQIPTFLVAQLARNHVTVALSGDGGDELFAGYNRYFWGRQLWKQVSWLPESVRQAMANSIQSISPSILDRLSKSLGSLGWTMPSFGDKMHKLAEILAMKDPQTMYHGLVSIWKNAAKVVVGGCEPLSTLTNRQHWARFNDFTFQMMALDLVTYLPDDILTKVDRASMAVSLEARVPLLDHRVVEFAWRIPLSMKIKREGEGKWLLRQVLYRYVPKELIERPKMGFGIPIDSWLRGPLRDWAEDLLSERRLQAEGYLCPAPIREKWMEHLSGRRNWQYPLWNVLMFQAWLGANDRTPASALSHH